MTIDLMWGFCSKKWTNKKINFVKLKTVVHYIPPPQCITPQSKMWKIVL